MSEYQRPSTYDFEVYVDKSGLPHNWSDKANCKGLDPNLFHPRRGESTEAAVAACAGCLVVKECLHYALSNSIHTGVWGGLSERQRRFLRAKRKYDENPQFS